ncbi:MAG: ATP-binding cassette domain-containing protein, partial [Rickettsiales bacterium]|nr:ATP-binding cassette domain-containing protein [Rickettsiales bacterium]
IYVTFGKKPLFDGLDLTIHAYDRISLVGKNGAGKTTLMQLISGTKEQDGGKRWLEPGTTIGYLQQDIAIESGQQVLPFIMKALPKEQQNEEHRYLAEKVLEPFEIKPDATLDTLSGGQIRRVALARSLVESPDILLLDEPTNHLDLTAIEWLENYLKQYQGTVLCVSHDKTFLANMSNKIFWLDRGRVRVCPKSFAHFDEWSQMLLDQEARELRKREKLVAQEVEWASKGISARRKRNVRRLELMREARAKLKSDKSLFNQTMQQIELAPLEAAKTSRVVSEFIKVHKTLKDETRETPILKGFNLRMMRGDRIGVLGKNGSGKTSFIRMITGELEPDKGKVKVAKHLEFSYFDQNRESLKPKLSMRENLCPGGGDYVDVMGKPRHVCGYLKDFLFDPKAADDLVGTLSGGQKNRLMLAKVLANPGNFLILDEPTNDLDMDTLDMLEEILSRYDGTLIVVSHDRDFLDQTVTKILAFEGNGVVEGYIGGYSDYLAAKAGNEDLGDNAETKSKSAKPKESGTPKARQTLSYKLQYELENLPTQIAKLEEEIVQHQTALADPDLYMKEPERFDKTSRELAQAERMLASAEERWLELEAMREELTGTN